MYLTTPRLRKRYAAKTQLISALGHKRFWYPTRILSEGTRNVLGAMEAHGVRRLVCETSLGIGDSTGRMGLYYTLFVVPVVAHSAFISLGTIDRKP